MRAVWFVAAGAVFAAGACFSKPDGPVPGRSDGGGGDSNSTGDAIIPDAVDTRRANFMFVTQQAWTGYQLVDPTAADGYCQAAAGTLPGTFKAWISHADTATGPVNAKNRLGTARGWVRTDGAPFADTVTDITQGRLFYPPRFDENGNDIYSNTGFLVYTGTDPAGVTSADDCVVNTVTTWGAADATGGKWTSAGVETCGSLFHLYCFGVDEIQPVAPPPVASGWRAFVSSPIAVTTNSLTVWEQACNYEAQSNGLPGTYLPLVAQTTQTARQRLPANLNGWYRPDDVKVASDRDFVHFLAPINVTADGVYVSEFATMRVTYGGGSTFDATATTISSCDNWQDPDYQFGHVPGDIDRTSDDAFYSYSTGFTPCNANHRVYCFQATP